MWRSQHQSLSGSTEYALGEIRLLDYEWPKHVVLILILIFKNIHPLYHTSCVIDYPPTYINKNKRNNTKTHNGTYDRELYFTTIAVYNFIITKFFSTFMVELMEMILSFYVFCTVYV